jgi:hypothetical protein
MFNNRDMKNTSDTKNKDVNKFNREIEALHKEWKQFSKQEIIDAMHKAGPGKKKIDEYLQKKAETAE